MLVRSVIYFDRKLSAARGINTVKYLDPSIVRIKKEEIKIERLRVVLDGRGVIWDENKGDTKII